MIKKIIQRNMHIQSINEDNNKQSQKEIDKQCQAKHIHSTVTVKVSKYSNMRIVRRWQKHYVIS